MDKNRKPELDDEAKANIEILKALDDVIQKGPWEHNLFFRGIGKKLRDIRDRFENELSLGELIDQLENKSPAAATTEQFLTVYISLYQADGSNIQKWASVISSLEGHSISRPVYRNEEDAQTAIRSKEFKLNDGYIAVRIRQEHILQIPGGKISQDKLGHELLVLREDAVHIKNILYFVHQTGRYTLHNGTLIKQA